MYNYLCKNVLSSAEDLNQRLEANSFRVIVTHVCVLDIILYTYH